MKLILKDGSEAISAIERAGMQNLIGLFQRGLITASIRVIGMDRSDVFLAGEFVDLGSITLPEEEI